MASPSFAQCGPSPVSIRRGAIACALALGALGFASEALYWRWRGPGTGAAVRFLSLSSEENLPTWYSSVLLFTCGLALCPLAARAMAQRAAGRWHWVGLAVGFFSMSLDEATEIHEALGGLIRGSGVLHFSWIIPAGGLVAALALAYAPFLVRLPARRRNQFLLAGALYLGGAILMELPLGWWAERAGDDNLVYAAIDHVEEMLEMIGAGLFLAALREEPGGP